MFTVLFTLGFLPETQGKCGEALPYYRRAYNAECAALGVAQRRCTHWRANKDFPLVAYETISNIPVSGALSTALEKPKERLIHTPVIWIELKFAIGLLDCYVPSFAGQ